MPFEPTERLDLGRTGLRVTRLGLGAASIGGLFEPVTDADAVATIDHAWDIGVRLFDRAPLSGSGTAGRGMGRAPAAPPGDDYVLPTRVGRLARPTAEIPPGADIDRQ